MNSKKAIKIDKRLIAAKMNIANIEAQKGNFYKAIELLEKILTEEPSYNEARANLAIGYKSVGQLKKSLNIYKNLDFLYYNINQLLILLYLLIVENV